MFPYRSIVLAALLIAGGACSGGTALQEPTETAPALARRTNHGAPPPSEVRTVTFGSASVNLWPYLGSDVSGTPTDPVNLLFVGRADPRAIRAALMGLDGDRTAFGFPASAPFDCRWSDTPSGDVQAAWTEEAGWIGGAIQLQCGDFAPIRFHLRLFRSGDWTLGGAHFEVLIPGTADHQVLSWELAEQLVAADLVRTGLLDPTKPLASSGPLHGAPSFRTIPAIIFNGLPPELQAVAAGAPGGSATDVPIPTDSVATILNIAGTATARPADTQRTFTLQYGQTIPKPFCNQPEELVYVEGPVTFVESATQRQNGTYASAFHGAGRLRVTPVNPATGQPSGESYFAEVAERHHSLLDDERQRVASDRLRQLVPANGSGRGALHFTFEVDSRGEAFGHLVIRCAP